MFKCNASDNIVAGILFAKLYNCENDLKKTLLTKDNIFVWISRKMCNYWNHMMNLEFLITRNNNSIIRFINNFLDLWIYCHILKLFQSHVYCCCYWHSRLICILKQKQWHVNRMSHQLHHTYIFRQLNVFGELV